MEESLESASVFAVLTPPGRGGIAVIRCVGHAAETALIRCFRHCGTPALGRANCREDAQPRAAVPHNSRSLAYGHIVDAEDRPLDEIILCHLSSSVFEVNCHGGPAAVKAVCDRLSELGLAQADPDRLMEIEGVPRLVRDARRALRAATTPLSARIILDQLNGALGDALTGILNGGGVAAIDALLNRWHACGRFIADPPRIAIAGRPNAGKSTLLNRLVGAERAITSPAPGTTRDYVEAEAALEGVPVILVDTAGLRDAGAGIEREGVERARREAARASVVVYLIDAGEGVTAEDEAAIKSLGDRAIVALNKADTANMFSRPPLRLRSGQAWRPRAVETISISALTGEGIAALVSAILERLGYRPTAPGDAVPFTAAQAEALQSARSALADGRPDDARRALGSLIEGP